MTFSQSAGARRRQVELLERNPIFDPQFPAKFRFVHVFLATLPSRIICQDSTPLGVQTADNHDISDAFPEPEGPHNRIRLSL